MNGSSDSKLAIGLVAAALILGVCVVGAAFLVKSSLDAGTAELAGVKTSMNEFKGALESAAGGRGQAAAARRGPDPARRYTLNTEGAPAKGVATAKVSIVEFSDFQ